MKKFLTAVLLICILSGKSYGAVSGDTEIYVRKDVFEVYMQRIDEKFDRVFNELKAMREDIKSIREEIKSIHEDNKTMQQEINNLAQKVAVLSERVDRNFDTLSKRIDGVDKRMDDLRGDIYLGLVILGLIAGYPAAKDFFRWRDERKEARKPSMTAEDVEKIVRRVLQAEMNNI